MKETNANTYPVHYAAQTGNLTLLQSLRGKGKNIHEENRHGVTPLGSAVLSNNLPIVEYLLSEGADMNVVDNFGSSALHHTKDSGIAQFLIDRGANVNAQNEFGVTPLMRAIVINDVAIAECLILRGASLDIRDKRGLTPEDYAIKNGNVEVQELIMQRRNELKTNKSITEIQQSMTEYMPNMNNRTNSMRTGIPTSIRTHDSKENVNNGISRTT
jgi:ankyrin repeat protein